MSRRKSPVIGTLLAIGRGASVDSFSSADIGFVTSRDPYQDQDRFCFTFTIGCHNRRVAAVQLQADHRCDQTSIQATAYEVQFALSHWERGRAPNQISVIETMWLTGNSSCDTTSHKFSVVNLVAQHDKATYQQFPGHGDFGFRAITPMYQSLIEPFQIGILPTSDLSRFIQQKAQQP